MPTCNFFLLLKIQFQNWCKIADKIGLVMTKKTTKEPNTMIVLVQKRVSRFFLTTCTNKDMNPVGKVFYTNGQRKQHTFLQYFSNTNESLFITHNQALIDYYTDQNMPCVNRIKKGYTPDYVMSDGIKGIYSNI